MRVHNCAFCREYEKTIGVCEIERKAGYKMDIRVCLYSKSTNRLGGTHYTKVHTPMKLRYCPSCGKKFDTRKTYGR